LEKKPEITMLIETAQQKSEEGDFTPVKVVEYKK